MARPPDPPGPDHAHVAPALAGRGTKLVQPGDAAAGARLADGTWLLASFHWVFAPPEEADRLAHLPRYNQPDELNPNFSGRLGLACAAGGNFLTRSATEGYTWEPLWPLTEQAEWPGPVACPPILERPGGELLLCVTATRRDETQQHSVLLRSADRGRTWGEPLCLTAGAPAEVSFHESRLVACPGGRLLAMHRTKGNYWRNVSTDGGRSWSPPEETAVWCGGSSPPDLRLLADGRLLLTRGHRREPFGVQAHLSEDAGETWDVETPVVLRDDGFHFDMGYPTSVQLPDGEMLTVYYWQGRDGIRHLQSTRWELPG
jgi:hypothetical protein